MATTLPADHPTLARTRRAVRHALAAAAVFTAFGYLSSHVHAVRAGSPWQDDPYDGVVSFTLFLTPALAVLTGARALLLRRDEPQPAYRIVQLLRASALCVALIAATVVADWTAAALRADRELWQAGTPWLIASVALPTLAAAAAGLSTAQGLRALPRQLRRARDGDWLDDLEPTLRALTRRLPGRLPSLLVGPALATATSFARRHLVALAATAALTSGVLLAVAQGAGEGWTDPLLVVTAAVIASGGFFAFAMLCNAALTIAVPGEDARHGVRRAVRHGLTAAALAAPLSTSYRRLLRPLVGSVSSVEALAVLVLTAGAVAGVVTFAVSVCLSPQRRQPGPTPPASGTGPG